LADALKRAIQSEGTSRLYQGGETDMRAKLFVVLVAAFVIQASIAAAATGDSVLRGTFLVAHVDSRGGTGDEHVYLLKTRNGYFDLHFDRAPSVEPNQVVLVSGARVGRDLHVSEIRATNPVAEAVQSTDALETLIMLVTWPSAPPDSVTPAQAESQVGGVDDAWYEEASYGRVGLAATATPWLTIADPGSGCPLGELITAAESAAAASGFTPGAYDLEMIYVPWTAGICPGAAGMAFVGGWISFIFGYMDTRVTVHEVGHNLGLWHSHSLRCTDGSGQVPYGPTCDPFDEYGDLFDAMGHGFFGVGHFNAAQKNRLGWISGRYLEASTPLRSRVRVNLSPLETSDGMKALAIRAGGTTFWVEYREAVGVDSWLSNWTGALNGVLVHIPQPSDGSNGSNLLDMTPNSIWGWSDAALPVGASYTDPSRSFTLTVRSRTQGGVTVVVRRAVGNQPAGGSSE
jgi:hypothetical protein